MNKSQTKSQKQEEKILTKKKRIKEIETEKSKTMQNKDLELHKKSVFERSLGKLWIRIIGVISIFITIVILAFEYDLLYLETLLLITLIIDIGFFLILLSVKILADIDEPRDYHETKTWERAGIILVLIMFTYLLYSLFLNSPLGIMNLNFPDWFVDNSKVEGILNAVFFIISSLFIGFIYLFLNIRFSIHLFHAHKDKVLDFDEEVKAKKTEKILWIFLVLFSVAVHVILIFWLFFRTENTTDLKNLLSTFLGLEVLGFNLLTIFIELILNKQTNKEETDEKKKKATKEKKKSDKNS